MESSRKAQVIDLTIEDPEPKKLTKLQNILKRPSNTSDEDDIQLTSVRKRWRGLQRQAPSSQPPLMKNPEILPAADRKLQERPIVLISTKVRELSLDPTNLSPTKILASDDGSKYAPSLATYESEEEFEMPPRSRSMSLSSGNEPSQTSNEEHAEVDYDLSSLNEQDSSSPEPTILLHKEQEHYTAAARPLAPDPSLSGKLHSAQELPSLGFRGYSGVSQGINSENGFRAGAFGEFDEIPRCPETTDRYYVDEATRHVSIDKTRPTPFISVTTNPIRAIHRAFGAGSRRFTNPKLAIIDLHVLRQSGTLQSAESLDLRPECKYDSSGEMLIWGEIKKAAITSVVDVADLLSRPPSTTEDKDLFAFKFLKSTWKSYFIRSQLWKKQTGLSRQTGFAVGQFLRMLKLSPKYHEAMISVIIRDFGFRVKKVERWQDDQSFCEGVKEGLRHDMPDAREFSPLIMAADSAERSRTPTPDSDSDKSSMTVQEETSTDTMMIDDGNNSVLLKELQFTATFAGLPLAYEMELCESEAGIKVQDVKVRIPLALSSRTVTWEMEILMKINESV